MRLSIPFLFLFGDIVPDGEKTITYTKTYTWVHVEIRWVYMVTPFIGYPVTLRCDVYVGP